MRIIGSKILHDMQDKKNRKNIYIYFIVAAANAKNLILRYFLEKTNF